MPRIKDRTSAAELSKPNIASVRSSGIAHGKKGGLVTITASASGVSGTTTLTVGTGTLASLSVSPTTPTCSAGATQQFAAVGTFTDGSTQDITLNSHWSSSSGSVATVANAPSVAGLSQCIAAGSSVIGANSGGNHWIYRVDGAITCSRFEPVLANSQPHVSSGRGETWGCFFCKTPKLILICFMLQIAGRLGDA
jgi:hypothetical protein